MNKVSKVAWIAAFGVLGMGCPSPEGRDTGTVTPDTGVAPSDTGPANDTGVRPNDTGVRPMDTGMVVMGDAGRDAFVPSDARVECTATQYRNAMGVCTALTTCTATQYESTAATATSDRVCSDLAVCTATQYESTAATATSNRVCSDLAVCTATQYESTAATATSNRVCSDLTVCTATQFESTAATATSNRVCSDLTVCTAAQYESTAATATSNRVCSDLTVCSMAQYQMVAPTATSNRVCAPLTVCTAAQYQTAAPTATSDRVCAAISDCTAGQFVMAAATATTNRVCSPCAMGTFSTTTNAAMCAPWAAACTAAQFQSTAPSATTNRVCTALTDCVAGQRVLTAPTATSNRVCTACAAATFSTTTNAATCTAWTTCVAPNVEVVAGSLTADRRCGPANDLPTGAVTIDMTAAASTFTVNTALAINNTNSGGACACTTGNDVFYNFTIPAGPSEIIYADTFGSAIDTSLFVQTSAGATVTTATLSNGLSCSDDAMLAGCTNPTLRQSQIMLQLAPGAYRLVLSGCGVGGAATIHFQHLPVGNGPVAALAAGASSPAGTTAGAGVLNNTCRSGTAPENTYYWYTCDGATGGAFTANTCGGTTNYDTVIDQRSATRAIVGVCNDDTASCGPSSDRSTIASTIPAGAGIHTLYVDGFSGNFGNYTVAVTRP